MYVDPSALLTSKCRHCHEVCLLMACNCFLLRSDIMLVMASKRMLNGCALQSKVDSYG